MKMDINAKDENRMTALMHAVSRHDFVDVEAVAELINNGADVNATSAGLYGEVYYSGSTVLGFALRRKEECVKEKYIQVVKLLIDAGADVNAIKETGLKCSYLMNNVSDKETSKLLLDAGIDVFHVNVLGSTALEIAESYEEKSLKEGNPIAEENKVSNLIKEYIHWKEHGHIVPGNSILMPSTEMSF